MQQEFTHTQTFTDFNRSCGYLCLNVNDKYNYIYALLDIQITTKKYRVSFNFEKKRSLINHHPILLLMFVDIYISKVRLSAVNAHIIFILNK